MSNKYDIKGLQTEGLITVSYPEELRRGVAQAVESWKLFCALPKEAKGRFAYLNGTGFELKEEKGTLKDLKEDFHVTLPELPRLLQVAGTITNPNALRFITDADTLVTLVKPILNDFAQKAEEVFSLPDFAKEVRENTIRLTLRFLHYFGDRTDEKEELAVPHADKGGFTLHLYESDPGLQYLALQDKQWREMPISEGETVIIPGMQMQFRSQNRLKALCHRVVANSETAERGRFSAVCFVAFTKMHAYNKSGKGRLQGFPSGFNYEMNFHEFSSLFFVQDQHAEEDPAAVPSMY